MANKNMIQKILQQFASNPSQIMKDQKLMERYIVARMLDDAENSIKALDALIGDNPKSLDDLKKAWGSFFDKAIIP